MGFGKGTGKKDISTHFFKIDFFNSFHLICLFAVSKSALIRAARTSVTHGDSADFQRDLLVPGVPPPSHPSPEPAATSMGLVPLTMRFLKHLAWTDIPKECGICL